MEDDLFEIITDALKQPLSFLIPKQDLISVLDRTLVSLPVEIGADLQQQSLADLEKLFEQLEVYDDEALTELEFPNILLNYRVSDDNRVTKELPFSERERLMISKESINFKMSDSNSAGGSLDTQTRGNSGETGSLFNSREYNGDGYLEEEPSSADVPVANDKLNDEVLVSNSNQTSEISPKHIETNSADSSSDDESLLVSNEDTDTDLLISRDITAASGSPSSIADTSKAFATEQALLKEQQVRRSLISNHPTKRQKVLLLEFIEDFPRIFGETPDGYDISGISRQLEMALSSITLAEIPKVREMLDLEDTRMIIDKLIAFANRLLASNLLHERLIHTQYLVWTELIEQINTIFILYHLLGRLHDFNKKIIFEEDLEILSELVVAVVTSIFNLNLSISRLDNPLSVVSTISNLISIPILFLKAGLNSDWLTVKMQVHLIPFIDRWLKFEDGIKSRTAPIMLSITKVLTQISSQSPTDSEALQEQLLHQLISLTENSSGSYVRPDSYSTIHLCTLNIISCINVPGINNINSDHKDLLRREMYKESYESNTDLLTMYNHLNKSVHNIATSIVKNAMEGNKMPLDIIFSDTVRLIENSSHGIALMFLEAIVSGISKYLHGDKVPLAIETYFVSICGEISYSLFRMDNKQNRSLMSVTASDMKSLSEVSMVLLSGFKNAHEIFKKKSIDYFRLSLIEKVIMIDKRSQSQNVFQTDEMSVDIAPEVLLLYLKLVSLFLNEYEPKVRDIYTDSFQMFARFALDATLNKAFDSILKSFASKRIKTRSKAINCFSRCVSIKPGLLGNEKFQVRLAELLKDGSPMVRDSCIELLNNYLKANPNFWEDFYRPILDCLSDSSIQVKKRVLAIVPSLYEQVLSQGSREYVLFRLLKGLEDDDENIREQVNKTLETLLINNYHESPRDTIDILIETININPKSAQLFELFLQTRVFSKAESKFQKCFVDILSMLIDNVILGVPDNKINGFLHLISIFVRCHGLVLPVQRLESLEPLIMNADNKKDDTLYHTFMILKYTLPSLQVVNDSFLDKILNHILSSLSRYTIKELHEAIPLAYIISKHKKDTIKLANVTISSLRMVYGFIKSLKEHDSLEFNGKLVKLMHILGCIGSYWDLESHRDLFIKADIGFAGKGPVLSLITKYLIHFNDMKVDIRIRRVFTLNLLSICLNHPKLYSHPTIMKHIDDVLNSTSEESIISKKVILQNIYDFIVMQEKESSKANSKVHSSSQSVDMNAFNGTGKEYENDAICSALAQRYASKTLELTYSKDYEFSIVSLKLATVIFGNGYVNPQMCIATFIGLLASDNQVVLTLAFESLKDLFDKHESMFEANYIEGFKNAVLYRYETCVNLFGNSVILKQLYSIISTKLTTRRKFIQALCKIFRIKTSLDLTESEAIFERDLVIFLLINIVNIPFVSLEEILLLYEASSKTLTRQGLDLYDLIKELDNQDAAKKKIACYGSNAGLCIMEFWNFLSTKYGIDIDRVDSSDLEARRAPKVKQNVSFNFRYQDILDDYNDDVKVNNMIMRFTSQISDIDL